MHGNTILIKSPEQIDGVREASKLAAHTLDHVAQYVKEGVSTEFLNQKVHEFTLAHNATPATLNYNGYPKSCCISLNEVICHGIPSEDTILQNGDILNIDVTPILNGYYGDTSRMFTIGEVSEKAQRLVQDTEHCLNLGIQQVYPGNRFGNIGFAISRFAKSKKYGVVYEFCGHGVGVEFHEEPQVDHAARKNTGAIMEPGMIFTIEPMINLGKAKAKISKEDGWTATTIDGKLSAQFEHTVLVTEEGHEILTQL